MTDEIQPETTEAEAVEDSKESTPESDEILSELTDTEVESEDSAADPATEPEDVDDETLDEEGTDDETPPEGEKESVEEPVEPDPKEEARRRYEERQALIAERKAKIKEQTQEYVDAADDETEQRLRAIEVQEYTRLIDHNEQSIIGEYERVKANPELQMFNQESPEFNSKAYDKAIKDYNLGYLGYDTNGNLTEVKGSLYDHLTETAELINGAVKTGQIKQVRDSRKMKANADSKPAATPKETKKDSILETLMSD